MQLLCFQDMSLVVQPCRCHNALLMCNGPAFHNNANESLTLCLWDALVGVVPVHGVYFVTHCVVSCFYAHNPIIFDGPQSSVIMGMLIYVELGQTHQFLATVGRLGAMGLMPCMYLRRLDIRSAQNTLVLHSEEWFGTVGNRMLSWQKDHVEGLKPRD
nr:hypothetical protein [Tawny frogmouth aviadenovirus A]